MVEFADQTIGTKCTQRQQHHLCRRLLLFGWPQKKWHHTKPNDRKISPSSGYKKKADLPWKKKIYIYREREHLIPSWLYHSHRLASGVGHRSCASRPTIRRRRRKKPWTWQLPHCYWVCYVLCLFRVGSADNQTNAIYNRVNTFSNCDVIFHLYC